LEDLHYLLASTNVNPAGELFHQSDERRRINNHSVSGECLKLILLLFRCTGHSSSFKLTDGTVNAPIFQKDGCFSPALPSSLKRKTAKTTSFTPENAFTRYHWAGEHKEWTTDLWRTVISSGECTLKRGTEKRRTSSFMRGG